MMPHTVTVEPYASIDGYGAITYGTGVSYTARVQGKNTLVQALTGEEKVARLVIYIAGTTVGPQDRITVPAPFTPTQPSILAIAQVSDEAGSHHSVVYA
jgi:hypothetical protein